MSQQTIGNLPLSADGGKDVEKASRRIQSSAKLLADRNVHPGVAVFMLAVMQSEGGSADHCGVEDAFNAGSILYRRLASLSPEWKAYVLSSLSVSCQQQVAKMNGESDGEQVGSAVPPGEPSGTPDGDEDGDGTGGVDGADSGEPDPAVGSLPFTG